MSYAELMSRSCFSLLDGGSQPHELVEAAAERGVAHLALADRDCIYGLVQAQKAAVETDVHLISGATVTVMGRPAVVLLAENRTGWKTCVGFSRRLAVEIFLRLIATRHGGG